MKRKIIAFVLAGMLLFGACNNAAPAVQNTTEQTLKADEADKSVYLDATQDVETRIEALLAQMT